MCTIGETFPNASWNEKCVLRPLSVLHSIVTTLTIREWSDAWNTLVMIAAHVFDDFQNGVGFFLFEYIVVNGSFKMKWMKPFIETQWNIHVTLFLWLSCWLRLFLCYYAAVSLLETSVYPLWSSLSVSRNMRHSLLWEPPMVHLILSSSSMSASWERCTIITSSMMRDVVMLMVLEKMNGSVSNLIGYGRNWKPRTQRTRRLSADSMLAFGLRVACVLYEFWAFGVSHFSLHKV